MRCQIITCLLDKDEDGRGGWTKTRFVLYREFDGTILGWKDLNILLPEEQLDDLPEPIVQQLGADGTALFESRNKAMQVKAILEGI